jgi:tripartite-type tricarboxylate transporter receptor subunit TctC
MKKIFIILFTLLMGTAQAEVITVTTAIGEGGSSTNIMRYLFSQMPNTTLIFNRKPGADGVIAANYYKQNGENNTFMLCGLASTFILSDVLYKSNKTYTRQDFEMVISLGRAVSMVVAAPNSKSSTISDIQKRIAAGENISLGSMSGIVKAWTTELAENLGSKQVTVVPYKSAGQLGTDIAGGHVEFAILNGSTATMLHKNDRIKIIAIVNNNRLHDLPDIPTVAETFKGFGSHIDSTIALMVPADTPKSVISQYNLQLSAIMSTPEAKAIWTQNQIYFNNSDLSIPLINKRLDNMMANKERLERIFK